MRDSTHDDEIDPLADSLADQNPHGGHRDRMRRKAAHDISVLEDHELLEIFLYGSIPYKDTNPVAHELLEKYGNLHGVLTAPAESVELCKNVTFNAAIALKVAAEMTRRAARQNRYVINNTRDFLHYIEAHCAPLKEEEFLVLGLDRCGEIVFKNWYRGERACVNIGLRELARELLSSKSVSVLMCHNHPGGTVTPSPDDHATTAAIENALSPLGIEVLDHIVVTPQGAMYSIKRRCELRRDSLQAAEPFSTRIRGVIAD